MLEGKDILQRGIAYSATQPPGSRSENEKKEIVATNQFHANDFGFSQFQEYLKEFVFFLDSKFNINKCSRYFYIFTFLNLTFVNIIKRVDS